jgi:uncharacterized protein YbjQ (UPF0145 family)
MILTTTNAVPKILFKDVKILGIVNGSFVQAKYSGKDIQPHKNSLVTEIYGYTKSLIEARRQAAERMTDEAEKLGADAVVKVSYSTTMLLHGVVEVMAYGTAVKFEQLEVIENFPFDEKPESRRAIPFSDIEVTNLLGVKLLNISYERNAILKKSAEQINSINLFYSAIDECAKMLLALNGIVKEMEYEIFSPCVDELCPKIADIMVMFGQIGSMNIYSSEKNLNELIDEKIDALGRELETASRRKNHEQN